MNNIASKIAHRLRDPLGVAYNVYEDICDGYRLPTISRTKLTPKPSALSIVNIGNFNTYNGGDAVLSMVLRDLIDIENEPSQWKRIHAHKRVNQDIISKINDNVRKWNAFAESQKDR